MIVFITASTYSSQITKLMVLSLPSLSILRGNNLSSNLFIYCYMTFHHCIVICHEQDATVRAQVLTVNARLQSAAFPSLLFELPNIKIKANLPGLEWRWSSLDQVIKQRLLCRTLLQVNRWYDILLSWGGCKYDLQVHHSVWWWKNRRF